jgi:hypothetical protein
VAVPEIGFPEASFPLQTMNSASQAPAQTSPDGAIDAIAVLEELKVNVGAGLTAPPVGLTADAEIVKTWPATIETEAGETDTWPTVPAGFFGGVMTLLLPPPPHPAIRATTNITRPILAAQDCMAPPRPGQHGRKIRVEFSTMVVKRQKSSVDSDPDFFKTSRTE